MPLCASKLVVHFVRSGPVEPLVVLLTNHCNMARRVRERCARARKAAASQQPPRLSSLAFLGAKDAVFTEAYCMRPVCESCWFPSICLKLRLGCRRRSEAISS